MAIDLQAKQQLAKWLAKPASVTQADAALLTTLIECYPYYQPLHLLLAKAKSDTDQHLLATAALYNGGGLLHKVLHQSDTFSAKAINLIQSNKNVQKDVINTPDNEIVEETNLPTNDITTTERETAPEDEVFEEITEATTVPVTQTVEFHQSEDQATAEEETVPDDEVFEEITEATIVPVTQTVESHQSEDQATVEEETVPDDEVFEEITEATIVPVTQTVESHQSEDQATVEEETVPDDEVFEEITEATTVPVTQTVESHQSEDQATVEEETVPDDEVFEEITEATIVPVTQNVESHQSEDQATVEEETVPDDEVFEEITEATTVPVTQTVESHHSEDQATVEEETVPDDEVFEEITEATTVPITQTVESHQSEDQATVEEETVPDLEVFEEVSDEGLVHEIQAPETSKTEEITPEVLPDELAIGNIVATDFFAFEQNFSTEQNGTSPNTVTFTPPEEYNVAAERQTVSKYDDDKLPYTFLWWLAKTRKEHAQIFQPYVTAKKQSPVVVGELQHQYVEHIFHLQTPFNITDEANKLTEQSVAHKGEDIIDSFIKNEPQIGTPKGDQINNENKAKKSAEDNYDLVSETLASIYIEQMLYHKAIDTYEKLSLKFPEKSRYFADLIQSLEKKI